MPQKNPKERVFIYLLGGVAPETTLKITQTLQVIKTVHSPKELHLLISSPGGNVEAGTAIHGFLKSLPEDIYTYNIGTTDSIANVIFLSADRDKRFAVQHATFLFHGIENQFPNGTKQTYSQAIAQAESLETAERRIAKIIAENCDLSVAEVNEFYKQGKSVDTVFAKEKGIIAGEKWPEIKADDVWYYI
jgi:ATP-dependent Clp protease protease subunit